MALLTRVFWLLALVAIVGGVFAFLFGPREPAGTSVRDYDRIIPDDLEGYLRDTEAAIGGITEGAQKRIIWADPLSRQKRPLAIIYLHGFAATSEEIRPVPDRVAAALSANLFYTRFAGHGLGGAALAQVTMNDWVNDLAEAMAVGRRIGERVVIIGTSSGGTLAAYAAIDGKINPGLAGVVLISPNFGLKAVGSRFLNMPYARQILPLLVGETQNITPLSAAQEKWWTTSYPTVAVLPRAALVKFARELPYEAARIPALFLLSGEDRVVSPSATQEIHRRWRAPSELVALSLGPNDDPARHVLAGDILSPGQTDAMVGRLVSWIAAL